MEKEREVHWLRSVRNKYWYWATYSLAEVSAGWGISTGVCKEWCKGRDWKGGIIQHWWICESLQQRVNLWYASESWHNADALDSVNFSCRNYANTAIIRALLLLSIEDQISQGSPECPQSWKYYFWVKGLCGFFLGVDCASYSKIGEQSSQCDWASP